MEDPFDAISGGTRFQPKSSNVKPGNHESSKNNGRSNGGSHAVRSIGVAKAGAALDFFGERRSDASTATKRKRADSLDKKAVGSANGNSRGTKGAVSQQGKRAQLPKAVVVANGHALSEDEDEEGSGSDVDTGHQVNGRTGSTYSNGQHRSKNLNASNSVGLLEESEEDTSSSASSSESDAEEECDELFPGVSVTSSAITAAQLEKEQQKSGKKGKKRARKDMSTAPTSTPSNIKTDSISKNNSATRDREAVSAFRRKLHIKVEGADPPDPAPEFSVLELAPKCRRWLLGNCEKSAWKEPTAVQMQAIPAMLEKRDVLAAAPTGSGKTAAYVIPTLGILAQHSSEGVRAILLSPTKELAAQIHREATRLAEGGGMKIALLSKAQVAGAALGLGRSDIIVSTPMRLVAAIRASAVSLSRVCVVVLDEADKLFDAGKDGRDPGDSFLAQVDEVLTACPKEAQRALFSATLGPQVKDLAASVLRLPVSITVGTPNAGATTIDQRLVFVGREDGKLLAMRQLVQEGLKPPVLIFLQSKDRAKALYGELAYEGLSIDAIHADRTPEQRASVIARFRSGELWVLICTDLMARGIDFKGVNMVINYDLPQSAVSYVHRIGRTGRAGNKGIAVTFFTEKDMDSMRSIANVVKLSGCTVPDWMLSMKRLCTRDRHKMERTAPRRVGITTAAKYDKKKAKEKRRAKAQQQAAS